MKKTAIFFSALIVVSLSALPGRAHAAFTLSVRPYEGGYDLRFGAVKSPAGVNKELMVQVVSDLGKQYQVVQFLLDPLTNAEGQTISGENFFLAAVRGSNSQGTLTAQHETPVSLTRTILYTSSSSGVSDSFKIVIGLRGQLAPGNYRGRMAFMLEPVNAATAPVTAIMNIFADVSADAQVLVTTQSGSSMLSLSPTGMTPYSDNVAIQATAALGKQFRILQVMSRPLEAADGTAMDERLLVCAVQSTKNGTGSAEQEVVFQRPIQLYVSGPRGEADSFVVRYALKHPDTAPAGKYRSRINFLLEGEAVVQQLLKSLDVQLEVPRVFDLLVNPESGGIIEFHSAGQPQQTLASNVSVKVRSNINKQYQVSQRLNAPLLNRQGQAIPEENFTVRQEARAVKGTLKFLKAAPVRVGDTTIFVSDRAGTPESFELIYELRTGAQVSAGDYSASIIYSISEI